MYRTPGVYCNNIWMCEMKNKLRKRKKKKKKLKWNVYSTKGPTCSSPQSLITMTTFMPRNHSEVLQMKALASSTDSGLGDILLLAVCSMISLLASSPVSTCAMQWAFKGLSESDCCQAMQSISFSCWHIPCLIHVSCATEVHLYPFFHVSQGDIASHIKCASRLLL